jgi:phosphate transport system protein
MIQNVLDAYVGRDAAGAEEVRLADQEVDQLHTSMFRELLTYMMEDPHNITPCTHLLFIAKNIERMGDHATNIAEQVHFLVMGQDPEEARPKKDPSSTTIVEPPQSGGPSGRAGNH